jgi:ankyrin repeat protein
METEYPSVLKQVGEGQTKGLLLASKGGFLEVVRYFLPFKRNYDGVALIPASQHGRLDIVQFLLNEGTHFYAHNNMSVTVAAENGHFEIVKLLMEQGATYHHILDIATERGYTEMFKHFLDQIEMPEPYLIVKAAENGHTEIVRLLLKRGVDISNIQRYNLDRMIQNDYGDTVRFLLESGLSM